MQNKNAIVLLSGGLDSATTLFWAQKEGFKCFAIIFDYGQRHKKEIEFAKNISKICKIEYFVTKLEFPWGGSSLIENNGNLPKNRDTFSGIPSTYVPARNMIFISIAAGYAEVVKANTIFIGANSVDYSGYPDCRTEFLEAMEKSINLGTKCGVENNNLKIIAPLINMSKKDIILLGKELGVPFDKTWSCYEGGEKECGVCDSCILRLKGFEAAKK